MEQPTVDKLLAKAQEDPVRRKALMIDGHIDNQRESLEYYVANLTPEEKEDLLSINFERVRSGYSISSVSEISDIMEIHNYLTLAVMIAMIAEEKTDSDMDIDWSGTHPSVKGVLDRVAECADWVFRPPRRSVREMVQPKTRSSQPIE